MDKIYQIYDRAYRDFFGNNDLFQELLESFVKLDWVKNIDFTTLKRIDTTFISQEYDKIESDIIYSVKFKNKKEIYIYVLLEFQSSVDKFMPVRCLNYITSFYLKMIKEKGKKILLPPIFPLVLYNGDKKWEHSNKIADFIENNSVLGKYGINFDIFMIKENEYSVKDLMEIGNVVSTLFMTDVNYDIDIIHKEIQKILDKNGITIPVKLFLNYFKQMSINEKFDIIDNNELEKLYKTKDEVNYMFLTAIKKEKEELVNKAKNERDIEIAINLLKEGSDIDFISKVTGLSIKDITSLRTSSNEKIKSEI